MERLIKIGISLILSIILIVFLFVIIFVSNNKITNEEYYVILQNYSYVYKENRTFSISIYSNTNSSLIEYNDKNEYFLILDSFEVKLLDVDIKKYISEKETLYKLEAKIPEVEDKIKSDNAKLKIKNSSYELNFNLGTFSIFNSNGYNLLSINRLYGAFSNINNEKRLVGININIPNNFSFMTNFKIGEYGYGILSKCKYNLDLDYEIDINQIITNYNIKNIEEDYIIGLQNNNIFIPLSYYRNYLTKEGYITVELDGMKYYIDTFTFLVNEVNKNDYPSSIYKGDLKYAKN